VVGYPSTGPRLLDLRKKYQARKDSKSNTNTPPTTPPAMAPVETLVERDDGVPVLADRNVVTGFEGFVVVCDRGTSVDEDAPEEELEVDVGDEVEVDAILMRGFIIVGIFTDKRLTCCGG
jgi:hypothetical protein